MPLMTVSECACPKSPPLLEQAASRGSHALFPVSGLRTTVVVQERPATYGPLSETSTSQPRSMAADSMPFGRVAAAVTPCRSQAPDKESRAFAPRYYLLSPCTPKGGLQAARQILSSSVFHSAATSHPLRSCSVSAPFPTHLPRARSPARLFLPLRCSFLTSSLQSQTRPEVSLSGCLCRAYTLRECSLTSFRVTWFPPSLPSPPVSSSLPAPTPHPSTSSKNTPPPARLSRPKRCG